MGRLIDADAEIIRIIEISDKHSGVSGSKIFSALDVVRILEQAPTAYDVDKVVEQIEKLPHRKLNLGDAMMDIMESKKTDRHFICIEDVIAIVKGAVKDEASTTV